MTEPEQRMIDAALVAAAQSACRSKRGVVLYEVATGEIRGAGHNGPPRGEPCPGRAICSGTCGRRSVHAEMRALRAAQIARAATAALRGRLAPLDLIHVELAASGGVVACAGPSCPGCAAQILDVEFVSGVWLYETGVPPDEFADAARRGFAAPMRPHWCRYTAAEFYRVTLVNAGLRP